MRCTRVCVRYGLRIIKSLQDKDYGLRAFVFQDPDGNRIDVGQPIRNSASRPPDRREPAKAMKQFRAAFPKIKARFDERQSGVDGLICKQGFYKDCAVLKLQKASWTNDRMDDVRNKSGIFFSIWIDKKAASNHRANYNIHALKLRQLKKYSITSRDFASDFRNRFASMRNAWPNASVDYGPLTLMQGWIEVNLNSLEKDLLVLMERFKDIAPVIDRLLESRRR